MLVAIRLVGVDASGFDRNVCTLELVGFVILLEGSAKLGKAPVNRCDHKVRDLEANLGMGRIKVVGFYTCGSRRGSQ